MKLLKPTRIERKLQHNENKNRSIYGDNNGVLRANEQTRNNRQL